MVLCVCVCTADVVLGQWGVDGQPAAKGWSISLWLEQPWPVRFPSATFQWSQHGGPSPLPCPPLPSSLPYSPLLPDLTLTQVSNMARAMVINYGFSEIGQFSLLDPSAQSQDMVMRMMARNSVSESLQTKIDAAVKKIATDAYNVALSHIRCVACVCVRMFVVVVYRSLDNSDGSS